MSATGENPSDPIRENIDDLKHRTGEAAHDALARGETCVRENPFPAVGIAFLIGIIAGAVLNQLAQPKRQMPIEATHEWLESTRDAILEKLPRIRLRDLANACPTSAVEHGREAGRHCKFW